MKHLPAIIPYTPSIASTLSCLALAAAFMFVLTGVRAPMSDGSLRYETFMSLWEAPVYHKYSTVQPVLTKLIDMPIRALLPDLPANTVPRYFELFLIAAFICISIPSFQSWGRPALLGALVPLSMMTHYFGQFFSEITSSALLASGFAVFLVRPGALGVVLGSALAALGLANWNVLLGPVGVVFAMAVLGLLTGREKNRGFVIFLLASLMVATCILIGDLMLKGQLFDNPYTSDAEAGFRTVMPYSGSPGFSHPIGIGLLGSLFSFGKSIFLFNPFLIFLFIRDYRFKPYMIASVVTALLIYSQWWAWYGGFSFGTRFYMFAVLPSLYVFLYGLGDKDRKWRALEPVALLLGLWLAICGKHFGLDPFAGVCVANDYALEAFCWYVPEFTPLISPVVVHGLDGVLARLTWLDYIYAVTVIGLCLLIVRQPGMSGRTQKPDHV